MRRKRFDKTMMLLMVPALACSLAAGVQDVGADTLDFGGSTYLTNTSSPYNLPLTLSSNDHLILQAGAVFNATGSSTAVIVDNLANVVVINNSGAIYAENAPAININALAVGTSINNLEGGEISVDATGTAISVAAIYRAGNLDGTLTNAGSISATVTASSDSQASATAYGISAGDIKSTLNNSGTISATAKADGSSAYALASGIATGDLANSLVNSGLISATATANSTSDYATAWAYGISTGDISGSLLNTGDITADASASAVAGSSFAQAYAYGISANDVSGELINNGTITATAEAFGTEATVQAYGISMGDLAVGGSLENNGTISATATVTGNADETVTASAYGISMGTLSGTMVNNGTITAMAAAVNNGTDSASAFAYGVNIEGTLSGTLTVTNAGAITAIADATTYGSGEAKATAYGIYVDGDVIGGLINNGSITATATAYGETYDAYAEAYGISMGSLVADLQNKGTITASATVNSGQSTGSSNTAKAFGISMGNLSGTLENTGSIMATATATNHATDDYEARATAAGIDMGTLSLSGSLINSGTIEAIATANQLGALSTEGNSNYATAVATGISMAELDGTLSNTSTGTINATAWAQANNSWAGAYAYGIEMNDVSGSLDNSGSITATATAISRAPGAAEYPSASAAAFGITADDVSGSLDNSGSISASATVLANNVEMTSAEAYAAGIQLYTLSGSLTNSSTGTISAMASAISQGTDAYASASGIDFGGGKKFASLGSDQMEIADMGGSIIGTGSLVNDGTITATASATASAVGYAHADAYGISVDSIGGAPMTSDAMSSLQVSGAGSLVNNGTITAMATASGNEAYAHAWGIRVGSIGSGGSPFAMGAMQIIGAGSLENTGTITAMATATGTGTEATASAYAYGVYVGYLDGTLVNSGTITGIADLPEDGYSLYVESGYGMVENLAGGLLSGNLYVGGDVEVYNNGTIELPAMDINAMVETGGMQAMGMGGSTAAYIGGNYIQDVNGVLSFGATAPDKYARLYVGGTADFTLGNHLNVNLTRGNTIAVGTTLVGVIDAETVIADSFNVTDNSALLAFGSTINEDGTVDLTAVQMPSANMVGSAGWSSAVGAAGALDKMLAVYGTPGAYTGMDDVLVDLRAMETERQVAEAIVTTLPSLRLELSRLTLDNSHKNIDLTRDRQEVARGLSSGSEGTASGNLWVNGFGSWADQSANNGAFGYSADTYGVMLGGDKAVSSRARIGLGLAFNKIDADGDTLAAQSADVKSYQPLLYGSYDIENQVDLSWHLGYGWHDNEVTRFVPLAGATAKGDYNSSSVNAGIAASRAYKMDEKTTLTPSVRLDYGYIDNDSYHESGAGPLSLYVGSSNVDELILGFDGKVDHKLNKQWALTAKLGLGWDLLAEEDSLNSAYAGASGVAFSTHGTDPSSWLYRGGLGVVYGQENALQVSMRYDLEGREDYTNQSVSLKLGMSF